MGLNEVGVASGNSLINPSGLPNANSSIQAYILRNKGSIDEIREYLWSQTEPYSTMGRGAFPFIDSNGNASMFELSGDEWWLEYDTMDPDRDPQGLLGIVVRANEFHQRVDGTDDESIGGRYEAATNNTLGLIDGGMLLAKTVAQGHQGPNFVGLGDKDIWLARDWEVPSLQISNAAALNSACEDTGFSQSLDPLVAVFHSRRAGGLGGADLYWAGRASVSSEWDSIENTVEFNSAYDDYDATMRLDGLEVFFVSTRPGGTGGPDIWAATREDTSSPWSPPVPVSAINSAYDDAGPCLSADGLTLYFHSQRPGGPGWNNIWMASRPDVASSFSGAVIVPGINSAWGECMASLSQDALVLHFASDRPGGRGDWDIWGSTRASTDSEWCTPENLRYVNSAYREFSPFFSQHDDALYLESTCPGTFEFVRYGPGRELATISRSETRSAIVVQGVAPGEDPSLTTMWVVLGQTNYGIAVPTWVAVADIPNCLQSGDMYDRATSLYQRGNESTIQASTLAAEAYMFKVVNDVLLPYWRDNGVPSIEEMTRIEHRMAKDAYSLMYCLDYAQDDNRSPDASFYFQADGLTVDFTSSADDIDGNIQVYLWDFGDNETSSAESPSHTYNEAGCYLVSCTVTDDDGVSTTGWLYLAVPTVPPDFDADGDVDQEDLELLEGCGTGPGIAMPPGQEYCEVADLDEDGDVDQTDFGLFQRCLSGTGVPADPACFG